MSRFIILTILMTITPLFFSWAQVSPETLSKETRKRMERVPEFAYIQEVAKDLGIDVYLFGGSASAFGHYIRWDLEREGGDEKYQSERFDYDFTNIYRGNQDLDIVVDGTTQQVGELHDRLIEKYPHFIGSRDAWEVRSLREKMGDKLPLLESPDFLNQHTDTNSIGMIAINADPKEIVYRDLFDWKNPQSRYLQDIAAGKVRYIYSDKHEETERFKQGKNPSVLSAIRFLAKVCQYEVTAEEIDLSKIKEIVEKTDWGRLSSYAKQKLEEFSLKALLNAPNSEKAWDLLDKTGFREKLIKMDAGRVNEQDSLSWWMSKEPLRSRAFGSSGVSGADIAKELGVSEVIVSHETGSFHAYENITRSARGEANAFISRSSVAGETAAYGNGFYTQIGRSGAAGTNLTIRFKLHPKAREGSDFTRSGSYIVVTNKKALVLIQEDLNLSLTDFLILLMNGDIKENDKGMVEKYKRKFLRAGDKDKSFDTAKKFLLDKMYVAEDFPETPTQSKALKSPLGLIDFVVQGGLGKFLEELVKMDVSLITKPHWVEGLLKITPQNQPLLSGEELWPEINLMYKFIAEILFQDHWAEHPDYDELLSSFVKAMGLSIDLNSESSEILEVIKKDHVKFYMAFPLLMRTSQFRENKRFLRAVLESKLFFNFDYNYHPDGELNVFSEPLRLKFQYRGVSMRLEEHALYGSHEKYLVHGVNWENQIDLLEASLREGTLPMIIFDKVLPSINPDDHKGLVEALSVGMSKDESMAAYFAKYLMNTAEWNRKKELQDMVFSHIDKDYSLDNYRKYSENLLARALLKNETFRQDDEKLFKTLRTALVCRRDGNNNSYPLPPKLYLDKDKPAHIEFLNSLLEEFSSSGGGGALMSLVVYLKQDGDLVKSLNQDTLLESNIEDLKLLYIWTHRDDEDNETLRVTFDELLKNKDFLGRVSGSNVLLSMVVGHPFMERYPEMVLKFVKMGNFYYTHDEYIKNSSFHRDSPYLKSRAQTFGEKREVLLALMRGGYVSYAISKYILTQERYLKDKEVLEVSIDVMIRAGAQNSVAKLIFQEYIDNVLLVSPVFDLDLLEILLKAYLGTGGSGGDYRYQEKVKSILPHSVLSKLLQHPNILADPNMESIFGKAPFIVDDVLGYIGYEGSFPSPTPSSVLDPLTCGYLLDGYLQ